MYTYLYLNVLYYNLSFLDYFVCQNEAQILICKGAVNVPNCKISNQNVSEKRSANIIVSSSFSIEKGKHFNNNVFLRQDRLKKKIINYLSTE